MTFDHPTLHDSLALSQWFLLALLVAGLAAAAIGLLFGRGGRLTARSRHLILTLMLVTPSTAKVHESSASCGVTSAVRTGHSAPVSYCPGGSRSPWAPRPRPVKPLVILAMRASSSARF